MTILLLPPVFQLSLTHYGLFVVQIFSDNPTKREIYTVLTSPNIDRKAREQFEIRTHKRLIDILDPAGKTIDALKGLTLLFLKIQSSTLNIRRIFKV